MLHSFWMFLKSFFAAIIVVQFIHILKMIAICYWTIHLNGSRHFKPTCNAVREYRLLLDNMTHIQLYRNSSITLNANVLQKSDLDYF